MNWQTTTSYFILIAGNFFLALVVLVDRKKHQKDPKEPLERTSYRLLAAVVALDIVGICFAGWGEYVAQAPRSIHWWQRDTLKSELTTRYHGTKFRIVVSVQNHEGLEFANEIRSALWECGWDGSVCVMPRVDCAPGVAVVPNNDDVGEAIKKKLDWPMPLFHDLSVALEDAGVQMADVDLNDIPENQPPRGVIQIDVGPKP